MCNVCDVPALKYKVWSNPAALSAFKVLLIDAFTSVCVCHSRLILHCVTLVLVGKKGPDWSYFIKLTCKTTVWIPKNIPNTNLLSIKNIVKEDVNTM